MIKLLLLSICCLVSGALPSFAVFPGSEENRGNLSVFRLPPFERAVRCIKFYERWHTEKAYPYIGFGHKVQPGENLTSNISYQQADSLLRSDLLKLCAMFRVYGKDSLLLATLSYNVGPYKVLGNSKYPKSILLKKIEEGNRDIVKEYLSFCHWNGKMISSIRRRRYSELCLLFF